MALARGLLYVWTSFTHTHLWQVSRDGHATQMRCSGWGHQYAEEYGAENLYCVAIPNKEWDALVVKAYDAMTEKEREKARRRVARKRKGAD